MTLRPKPLGKKRKPDKTSKLGADTAKEDTAAPIPAPADATPSLFSAAATGRNCGEKEQFLDWLSWGVESRAIDFPDQSGPIRWPRLSLKDIFMDAA